MKALCLTLLFFALVGCNYQYDKGEGVTVSSAPLSLRQSVSFEQVYSEVFASKCIGCHGQSGNVELETYRQAIGHLVQIKDSVFKEQTMPKSPLSGLSKRQQMVLMAWIEEGGPEFARDGSTGGTPRLPLEPTFTSIKKNILESKCLSCHSAGQAVERIPLVTISDLVDSPLEIVLPGNPEESGLMLVTDPSARKPMPPIDSGFALLTENEREIIRQWILQGAPSLRK